MRLRSTAPPARRPTANATRGGPAWAAGQHVSTRGPRRKRRAEVNARKARGPRTLQIRRRAGRGPSVAGSSAAPDPRGSSCGDGTRASCCGGGCWVGTCASRMASSAPVGAQLLAPGTRARLRRPRSLRPFRTRRQSGSERRRFTVPGPPCRPRRPVIRSRVRAKRTGPARRMTSPECSRSDLGEAARAAAGPSEGFLHTCGCCCGQPGRRLREPCRRRRPVEQGLPRRAEPARGIDLEHVVPGRSGARPARRRRPAPRGPERARDRAHPHELRRDPRRRRADAERHAGARATSSSRPSRAPTTSST